MELAVVELGCCGAHITLTFASSLSPDAGSCRKDMIMLSFTFKSSSDLGWRHSSFW